MKTPKAEFKKHLTRVKKSGIAQKFDTLIARVKRSGVARKFNALIARSALFSGRRKWASLAVSALLLLAVIVSLVYPFIGKRSGPEESLDLTSDKSFDDAVETYEVVKKEVSNDLDILGQIVFSEKVSLSSKVMGRLSRIYVKEGDKVSAGQVIAEIERLPLQITLNQQMSDLNIARKSYELTRAKYENALKGVEIKLKSIEKARADLNDKRVSYDNMDRILKNKRALYEIGGLSESEVKSLAAQHTTVQTKYELAKKDYDIEKIGYRDEDIKNDGYKLPKGKKERTDLLKKINTKIEKAELEAARSRIQQAEENIKATKILLAETYIRSPIHGVVASKNMEAGEMVKEDSVIAVVMDIARVFLAMNVNERDYQKIKSGQTVSFTVDAIGNESFKAEIKRITPVLDVKTRTIEVKAEMANPGYRLLPGMFARAQIETSAKENKLVIPKSAVIKKEGTTAEVYVVKRGIVFRQGVTVGAEYPSWFEVIRGLSEGDLVVSKGINIVYPQMKLADRKKTTVKGNDRKADQ